MTVQRQQRCAENIRNRSGKWWRRASLALFVAMVPWSLLGSPLVSAQPSIHMSSVVGFNGFYSKNQWVPVTMTIVNNGPATNAELDSYVDFGVGDRMAQGTLRWQVRLPAYQTVTKQIAVPGPMVDRETVECVVNGQPVASSKLSGTALGSVSLVGVLSKDAQLARVLTGLTDGEGGNPVLPVTLFPANLPDAANLLSGLTAITLKPDTITDTLTPQQRNALLTWVKLGGMLIVTGADTVPGWTNYLPILPGPEKVVKGDKLASFLSGSVTPPQDFEMYGKGVLSSATVWAGTSDEPYIAALKLGRGTIVQTSFNPTQPSLVSWSSNAALWTKLLQQGNPQGASAIPDLLSSSGALQLVSASDALSPLKIPSLSFWASVFLVYAVCAGPVLFLVLRKWKSEPLAWFILPSISVVTTIGIYLFGANQRPPGMLTEGVGVLDLVGDGTAESYGIRGFMSPAVTSGFATTEQPMLALPLEQHNVRELGYASTWFRNNTTVAFDNVGRWGVRYIYTAGAVQHQGELDAELWADHNTLIGRITNHTKYPLHDLAVFWGGRMLAVGDLKPGESTVLNRQTSVQVVATNGNLSSYSSYNRDIVHGIGRPLGTLAANEHLFEPYSGSSDTMVNTAMLIATTPSATPGLPDVVTGQAVAQSQAVVLVRQFTPVSIYPNTEVTAE
ncbi:hypothetical protein [Alicyclobacillus pomorum]|uniref:hypothetical protein n=1 Tax=Alicyclobacillus pomorum TaxID=204470 RepID=UPI0012EC51CB|nr:hypothetical protein [Alicyclobacillus pomorum]